ncbi:MAG: hypothetical protein ACRCT1_18205 [Microcoleaceae cyanobacterium]|jgi:hypothetical protein
MLKFVLVALVTLEVVLLTTLALAPANATSGNTEFYTWNFANLGSSQLVCKRVEMLKRDREMPPGVKSDPVNIDSIIVDDRFCANLAKPILSNN